MRQEYSMSPRTWNAFSSSNKKGGFALGKFEKDSQA